MSPQHCDAHGTASSTSRSVERPPRPLTTPSAGLTTFCDLPLEAATCPPSIMLGMVSIADVVTAVFIVRLRIVWVSVAKAVNFNRPIVYSRAKTPYSLRSLKNPFEKE
jgi:hypothetical protein